MPHALGHKLQRRLDRRTQIYWGRRPLPSVLATGVAILDRGGHRADPGREADRRFKKSRHARQRRAAPSWSAQSRSRMLCKLLGASASRRAPLSVSRWPPLSEGSSATRSLTLACSRNVVGIARSPRRNCLVPGASQHALTLRSRTVGSVCTGRSAVGRHAVAAHSRGGAVLLCTRSPRNTPARDVGGLPLVLAGGLSAVGSSFVGRPVDFESSVRRQ